MQGLIQNGFDNSLSKPCMGCHFTEQIKHSTPLMQCQRCNCTGVPSFTRHESTRKGRGSVRLAWPLRLPLTLQFATFSTSAPTRAPGLVLPTQITGKSPRNKEDSPRWFRFQNPRGNGERENPIKGKVAAKPTVLSPSRRSQSRGAQTVD